MLDLVVYFFGLVAISSSLCMIFVTNPVHSVLYLVLIYVASAGIIVVLGAEFLAIVIVVVYVGAIAILFLFVVMMLNVDIVELEENFYDYIFMSLIIGYILINHFSTIFFMRVHNYLGINTSFLQVKNLFFGSNMELIGRIMFLEYNMEVILSGIILLIGMIGAIVLTMFHRVDLKRQEVYLQLGREYQNTILRKRFL